MKQYKGIVIGPGKIGTLFETNEKRIIPRSHASTLAMNPRTELVAFVGTEQGSLEAAGKLFPQAKLYSDLTQCLSEIHPDIAIVAANTPAHAAIITTCAQAGVPMIIGEKPLAASLDEARGIKEAVDAAHTTFVLNYQRRFFPLFERARQMIAEGSLGRIQQVTCYYDNGLYNNGGHAIDAVLFLLGERVTHAIGAVNDSNTTHPENDPNVDGFLFTDHGTAIALQSFDQKKFGIHELRIYGENGALIISDYGYGLETIPLGAASSGLAAIVERDERSMTVDALAEAIAAYEEKRRPGSGIENGIEALAVLEMLRRSSRADAAKTPVVYTGTI